MTVDPSQYFPETYRKTAHLVRLRRRIGALRGWRRALASIGFGLIGAAAVPPLHLFFCLIPSFVGFVWLLDGAKSRWRGMWDGFFWGMGYFVPSLYWIIMSMLVDVEQFWWMIPFSLFGLPAFMATYTAGAGFFASGFKRTGLFRIFLLAGVWGLWEWARGTWATGFPWAAVSYTWSADAPPLLAILQLTALVGAYGLSALTVLVAAMPAYLGDETVFVPQNGGFWRLTRPLFCTLVGCCLALGWGLWRLAPGSDPIVPDSVVRIVSSNFPQLPHYSLEADIARLRGLIAYANRPGKERIAATVWPEGAVDFYLNREPNIRAAIATAVPPQGILITGTLRAPSQQTEEQIAWNNVSVLDGTGTIIGSYDKAHLVPFGEYVPYRSYLKFAPIVARRVGFGTGPGAQTLALPNLPAVSPVICYEAIFPHDVVDEDNRPGWIANLTNDSWFGFSTGPYQHFVISRTRAVEEGIPMVRAANGGISGLFDAHGRTIAIMPLGSDGILDVNLPEKLPENTIYGQYGHSTLIFLSIFLIIFGAITSRGRIFSNKSLN